MEFEILNNNFWDCKFKKLYRVMIIQASESDQLTLPVTPWKYSVNTEQRHKVVDILDFGEGLLFGNPRLKQFKVSCFFPEQSHEYAFVVGDNVSPEECVEKLTKYKESKSPVRVIITQSNLNLKAAIESFDYKERDGTRDIYFDLKFIECRDFNVPNANYVKNTDEETGLKTRPSELASSMLSQWVKTSGDIFEASMRIGTSISTLKSKTGISHLANFNLSSLRF